MNEKFMRATAFAAQRHAGQLRKDHKTPYIVHPMRVAMRLAEAGITDVDTLCVAVLHDTIEDTNTDHDEILERFGANVALGVCRLTKDKRQPSTVGRDIYEEGILNSAPMVQVVKLADIADNLSDEGMNPRDRLRYAHARAPFLRRLAGSIGGGRLAESALDALRAIVSNTALISSDSGIAQAGPTIATHIAGFTREQKIAALRRLGWSDRAFSRPDLPGTITRVTVTRLRFSTAAPSVSYEGSTLVQASYEGSTLVQAWDAAIQGEHDELVKALCASKENGIE